MRTALTHTFFARKQKYPDNWPEIPKPNFPLQHIYWMHEFQQMPSPTTQQKTQKVSFDRGAKLLPPVKTGDTVRLKTRNGWKRATVTKFAPTPRSVIVTSKGAPHRRNRRDSNTSTITSQTIAHFRCIKIQS